MVSETFPVRFVLIICVAYCCCAEEKPAALYPIKEINITVTNGTSSFEARVWFPVVSSATKPSANASFPIIAFAHCLFGGAGWYSYVVSSLVPNGYIFASTAWRDFLPAGSAELAIRQLAMYYAVVSLGADPSSELYGLVGSTAAVMGHSLGGSSTLLLAEKSPNIFTSALPLSGCIVAGVEAIRIPTMLLTGTSDCICGPQANADPMYNKISSSCKILADLVNATHCNFAEFTVLDPVVAGACSLVELAIGKTSGCAGEPGYIHHITAARQFALVDRYALPFLDWTLKGQAAAGTQLLAALDKDSVSGVVQRLVSPGCHGV